MNRLLPGCARLECHYKPSDICTSGLEVSLAAREESDYPLFSIVVPSYMQGHFLEQTLKSIVDQKYPMLELIIVDGGSEDETMDVIKKFEGNLKWWVSEPDSGQANAINKGMTHATGDILAWLNSDDCLMPGALFRVAEAFMKSKSVDVVYGHRVLINENGQDVGKWILPGHREMILSYADYIPQETMYWRSALWRDVGSSLDESFSFAMDWELIHRFLNAGAKFKVIPAFLGQFRIHEMQKTHAKIATDGAREMEIIRERCRQKFSRHPFLQNLYYRMQRASLYSFLLRARLVEVLWKAKLYRID